MGAWLKPPPTEAANPDPYENVVITLPVDPSGAVAGWAGAPPYGGAAFAIADSRDSGIAWGDPGGRSGDSATADSAPVSLTLDAAAGPEPLTPATLEQVLPAPGDDGANWPSRQGDILALAQPARAATAQAEPPQGASTRSQDPRDWDLPDSAYQRAKVEVRAGAAEAPAG